MTEEIKILVSLTFSTSRFQSPFQPAHDACHRSRFTFPNHTTASTKKPGAFAPGFK